RNTLDTLEYVRQLKEKRISVFFEKENVDTLDSKGELLISLLASLAQEESNTISQNTRMGISYRFQEGKIIVNHTKFLGYTKDENGNLIIVIEEAEIVRRIFKEFIEGKSPYKIAAGLERDGKLTGSGGSRWYDSMVIGILKNEKYQGDALLQKTYTVDFLSKKRVDNNGHAAQYYVEDSHPAIISKEEFAAAQAEFKRRSSMRGYSKTGRSTYTGEYVFSGKLFCQNCGSKFRRSAWGTGKNKKHVWICINHQMNGDLACEQKAVKEKDLELGLLVTPDGLPITHEV
ncbi:MAG: recombinase family protein, partial [Desulfitobacteriaceae bacterium]|nr:recombinase family protein [Desulfitobacteriaceae bacterium]